MGCDIHVMIEKYKGYDKKWIDIDYYRYNEYLIEEDDVRNFTLVPIYDDRNYALFSILANVRNYYENDCIDEPRGIPDDCSDLVKEEVEYWGTDGHSHSYFTYGELVKYRNKHHITKYSGLITIDQAKELDEKGKLPDSWCQWTNMKGYVRRSWVEEYSPLDELIEKIEDRIIDNIYYGYYKDEEDKKEKLSKQYDNVRIVFWFDN